ncbi:uncharacterized protein LOC130048284 [Ostrea edulis]|uniref:uncharacterized protein LOC130048284 n=1 Tax=Ostrea edulis TaxID=37623 RepID=UPI0024AEF97A|nr:uncharacterized protein LOC130048284 [Ostrea edulis]
MQLEEIKKCIIHDAYQRPLCRTMMTMSIDIARCTESIDKLQEFCKRPKSIYFQDCFSVNCPGTSENKMNETEAILMSAFPKPKLGIFRQGVYEIPTSHCNMKQCMHQLQNCSTKEYNLHCSSKDSFRRYCHAKINAKRSIRLLR